MRPIRLVMTGFESYKEKTVIDFEQLGQKGLYLITGDTGAGKTTLFDAISFALYGKASGADRLPEMLRSHFADETTPTEVELDFEADGKKYHIKRNPDYERKSLRGNGITKESANAVLEFLSESREPVAGLTKVNAEVESILNLKHEQFCKIAMIAQGSFQEFLISKKEDKQDLLRSLFHTEKYQKLQDELKEDGARAKKEVDKLNEKLTDALARIDVDSQDENAEEISRIKTLPLLTEEDVQTLKDFVSKDEKQLQSVMEQIKTVEEKLKKISEEITIGESRKKIQTEYDEAQKELAQKKQEQESVNEVLALAEEEAKQIPELEKEKTLLGNSLKQYEEITEQEKNLNELKARIEAAEKEFKAVEQKKEKLLQEEQKLKKEAEEVKNAGEQIGTLEALVEKNDAEENELKEIETLLSNLAELKSVLEKAQEDAKDAIEKAKDASDLYSEKQSLFNLEQAGILAETLAEGKPCPVCGSTEHPHPAVKSKSAPSQAELKAAKETADTLNDKANKFSVTAAAKKRDVENAEANGNKLVKKYFENLSVNDETLPACIQKKKNELKAINGETNIKLAQEKKARERREELAELCSKNAEALKEVAKKEQELTVEISAGSATLKADEKNLKEKKAGLQFEKLEEAEHKFDLLSEQIETFTEKRDTAKQKQVDIDKELVGVKTKLIEKKKQLAELKAVDLEALRLEEEVCLEQKESLNERRDSLNKRKGLNQDSEHAVEKLLPELEKAKERHAMISSLNEVAMGSCKGKKGKPSLEVFVQMNCLDHINQRANLRLKKMTENKYALRRRVEADGSELGLDLNVKDFYTGRERGVESLSGGEKFQASLSLALGLADEIQENAGGIKLDTMFIDEGFGTLDPETLHKAMRALEDLSQGNKLIGIISHVDELESRIPKKIVVKKDEAGVSHASIRID